MTKIKAGQYVHDSWWPWKGGKVLRITARYVYVLFGAGCPLKTVRYDHRHANEFLRVEKGGQQ